MKTAITELLGIEYPIIQGVWPGSERMNLPLPCQRRGA